MRGAITVEETLLKLYAWAAGETMAKALVRASEEGNVIQVTQLLEGECVPVDAVGDRKRKTTALMAASAHGHDEVVRLLLDRGARLDLKDRSGYTALYWAAAKGHAGVVALLLRCGAQATLRQQGGWTALMVASFKGYTPVVKLLLKHGPVRQAVNDESWDGETALWLACSKGHADVVRTLLLQGHADCSLPNHHGMSPRQIATIWGYKACLDVLQEWNNQTPSPSGSNNPPEQPKAADSGAKPGGLRPLTPTETVGVDLDMHRLHQPKQTATEADTRRALAVGYY